MIFAPSVERGWNGSCIGKLPDPLPCRRRHKNGGWKWGWLRQTISIGERHRAAARDRPWFITIVQCSRWLALDTHYRLRARTLTSQKFNSVRELVTSLHRDGAGRSGGAIYLFTFVVDEYMHTFVAISIPRGPKENQESNQ